MHHGGLAARLLRLFLLLRVLRCLDRLDLAAVFNDQTEPPEGRVWPALITPVTKTSEVFDRLAGTPEEM